MPNDEVKSPLGQSAQAAVSRTTPVDLSILVVGLLLSTVMIIPSIRITPVGLFTVVFHPILLAALSAPFVILYLLSRNRRWAIPTLTSGALFSLGHLYLIYVSYARLPQEFGYIGLILAPALEAIVVVPLTGVFVLIFNRLVWRRVGS